MSKAVRLCLPQAGAGTHLLLRRSWWSRKASVLISTAITRMRLAVSMFLTMTIVDCLIIGGGPAGLTAATYLARYRRSVTLIDGGESR